MSCAGDVGLGASSSNRGSSLRFGYLLEGHSSSYSSVARTSVHLSASKSWSALSCCCFFFRLFAVAKSLRLKPRRRGLPRLRREAYSYHPQPLVLPLSHEGWILHLPALNLVEL